MPEISRRSFGTAMIAAAAVPMIQSAPSERPNILFICADEHGGPFLGSMGHPIVKTPNFDRLAAAGVQFRNTYCGSPVCVPARAGMMSGMFPSDVFSYCNSTPFRNPVPTWGKRLRDVGYDCWATGKLDLTEGTDYGFHEVDTGHGHSTNPDITSLLRAPMCFRATVRNDVNGAFRKTKHHDVMVLEHALRFLREDVRRTSKPWVVYAGFTSPHYPFVAGPQYASVYPPASMPLPRVPLDYLDRRHPVFEQLAAFQCVATPIAADRIRRARAAYFGMITELDRNVGLLLDELEKTGQMEKTLIIYTSDHGEMLGENGLWFKNVLMENAARVPLIMAGAGLPQGKKVDTPVMHIDMVATMLEMAGAAHDPKLRGHSLGPLAQGQPGAHPGIAYSESHSEGNCTGSFMIRKANWKYIYPTGYEPVLFDLHNDPGEQHNVAGRPETSAIQKELHADLLRLVPDPDALTERAFAAQQALLEKMLRDNSREQFYEGLRSRLGAGQARILSNQFYRQRKG
ncbi:MAG TPA: sulfatase-like hydrolase/transferase [Bryobacteraceae bacterium]|nr:sulfatase-like hydrolase/transferase [Bryobacteraceae bacterium]